MQNNGSPAGSRQRGGSGPELVHRAPPPCFDETSLIRSLQIPQPLVIFFWELFWVARSLGAGGAKTGAAVIGVKPSSSSRPLSEPIATGEEKNTSLLSEKLPIKGLWFTPLSFQIETITFCVSRFLSLTRQIFHPALTSAGSFRRRRKRRTRGVKI